MCCHTAFNETYKLQNMTLHAQIKRRRCELGLTQQAMESRIGMSRQQYQRLESQGNPRLDSLQLVAQGLNAELMLIPREKLHAVRQVLEDNETLDEPTPPAPDEDPWHGLLDDLEQGNTESKERE
ncbi:helix-turn-helix transcriptional regulator [Modicisalibacter xianhensis]|uniref:helix-turn-helix domain-containing protein n=1 Tax=Modicisalibacter xianhensis TaxID=442341 RepID=UPI0030EEAE64